MRKSKFKDSQIMAMLKQNENGIAVADLCREHGLARSGFGSVACHQQTPPLHTI